MLMAKRELPLLLVAVYLKHSDTLQGPVNSQIMAKLLALLQETRYQFLLLGHWNTPPSSFEERAWLHVSTNRLGCSLAPTCSGHLDLRYTSQATAIQLYDIEPNKEAQTLADWVSITEQYLLQEHPWQPQGRGCWVQAPHKPLAKPPAGPLWRRGKPAYWEQLKARLQLALQTPASHNKPIKGFLQAGLDAPKQWVGPPTAHTFLGILHHWKQYRDDKSAELLMHTVQHQITEAHLQARDEAALQYQQCLVQGEAKGLRGLLISVPQSIRTRLAAAIQTT